MPWRIDQRNGEFCVIKKTDNSVEKCHSTRQQALAHLKALYASESKNMNIKDEVIKFIAKEVTDGWKKNPVVEESTPDLGFSVFKNASGDWRWQGVYSDDVLDKDEDILTREAHDFFLKSIELDIWPMPELWPFHVNFPVGQADDIALVKGDDGHNYMTVTGHSYSEHSYMFEKWSQWPVDTAGPLGMSHGMPNVFITRDASDPGKIIRYLTKELSVLPLSRAANDRTSFIVEENMKKLNESQLEFLKNSGMEDEKIEELQKMFEPEEDSLEKEDEAEVKTDTEEKSDIPAQEDEEKSNDPESTFSPQDIQKLFVTVAEGLGEVTTQIGGIAKSQQDVAKRLEVLERNDEDRIAQKASETPAASLEEMLKTAVVGGEKAKVDGRTSLAKDAPKETPAPDTAPLPGVAGMIPLLSTLQKDGDWREVFQKDNGGAANE